MGGIFASKGYALRVGECQRKDGRYSYSYTDRRGKRFTVYEKSLVDLRAREKEIRMDLDYGVSPDAANRSTLNDMYDRYIAQKYNLKVIQDIMGHADISTTMDIYAEAMQEKKQEVMANLQGKIF